jgi:hypothetical protein
MTCIDTSRWVFALEPAYCLIVCNSEILDLSLVRYSKEDSVSEAAGFCPQVEWWEVSTLLGALERASLSVDSVCRYKDFYICT